MSVCLTVCLSVRFCPIALRCKRDVRREHRGDGALLSLGLRADIARLHMIMNFHVLLSCGCVIRLARNGSCVNHMAFDRLCHFCCFQPMLQFYHTDAVHRRDCHVWWAWGAWSVLSFPIEANDHLPEVMHRRHDQVLEKAKPVPLVQACDRRMVL